MDLCQFCQKFAMSLCGNLHRGANFLGEWPDYFAPLNGMLKERIRSCRLCHLVDYHAAKIREDPTRSFYSRTKFKISAMRSDIKGIKNPLTQIMIISSDTDRNFIMAVWASLGNGRTNQPSRPLLTINRYPCRHIGPHQLRATIAQRWQPRGLHPVPRLV